MSERESEKLSQLNLEEDVDDDDPESSHEYEQHEMPLGWIKCCDENGTYYWHKPTGTVTRKNPLKKAKQLATEIAAEKKCEKRAIKPELSSKLMKSCESSSASSAASSSSSVSKSTLDEEEELNEEDDLNDGNHNYESLNLQEEISHTLVSSKLLNSSNNIENLSSTSSSQSSTLDKNAKKPEEELETHFIRYYVRSMGWVRIDESDLTPEKSSRAVNKCINDLSKGVRDLNDAVARWGDGKDLYLDLQDSYLVLVDPIDEKILNKQSITSIRVWGVGRGNGR